MEKNKIATGTIKFYNANKGFGFINTESGSHIFFHLTNILGYQKGILISFNDGDAVSFLTREGSKGIEAIDVSKIGRALFATNDGVEDMEYKSGVQQGVCQNTGRRKLYSSFCSLL
jgi:cold shock protein